MHTDDVTVPAFSLAQLPDTTISILLISHHRCLYLVWLTHIVCHYASSCFFPPWIMQVLRYLRNWSLLFLFPWCLFACLCNHLYGWAEIVTAVHWQLFHKKCISFYFFPSVKRWKVKSQISVNSIFFLLNALTNFLYFHWLWWYNRIFTTQGSLCCEIVTISGFDRSLHHTFSFYN